MVVLGGLGNNRGALLGALIVTVLDRVTAVTAIQLNMMGSQFEFNYVRFILFGIILLVMLRYRPQGLLPEPVRTTLAHDAIALAAAPGRRLTMLTLQNVAKSFDSLTRGRRCVARRCRTGRSSA